MDKYHLIIFGDTWDVYQIAHRAWIEDSAVCYIPTFRPHGLLGQLQRLQFNPRINNVIKIPGKNWWNSYYLRNIRKDHLCFLITEPWLRLESGIKLLPYLRKTYPDSKMVCYTQDLIHTIKDQYTHRPINVDYIKKYVDLFISYDTTDAEKHNISYHPTVYSPLSFIEKDQEKQYDLFFLGRDKGRLQTLINIAQEAKKRSLKCSFILLEVPKAQRIACEGISYYDGTVSYRENLKLCASSKCILELLQQEASSPTFRTWEAIMLNKKLVTNNHSITGSEIYDNRYLSVFNTVEDMDWGFIKAENSFCHQQNPYQQRIMPSSLIHFIEDHLQIQIAHT